MTKTEMKNTVREYMAFIENLIDVAQTDDDLLFLREIVREIDLQMQFVEVAGQEDSMSH